MPGNATASGGPLITGQIALSVLSLFLLVFTSILGYFSYSAQARTGIRESIEQLDDVEITTSYKLKPILHRFEFGPLDPKSVLLIKLYKTQHNEATASIPVEALGQYDQNDIEKVVGELEKDSEFRDVLEESYVGVDGIFFELSSRNGVAIRRFANKAMSELRDSWLS